MVWLILWILLAGFVLGVFVWQLLILREQKQAWEKYSKRHKLEYEAGSFYGAPTIHGEMDNKKLSIYTDSQQTEDMRGQRFITAIEIELGSGMPTGGALGTAGMKNFIETLVFDQTYKPDHKEWKEDYVLRTRDAHKMKRYLTGERLEALMSLFSMKSVSVLYFFDELEAVLRIETTDPLRDADRMEKIIRRILDLTATLSLSEEEASAAAAHAAKDAGDDETPETPEGTDSDPDSHPDSGPDQNESGGT